MAAIGIRFTRAAAAGRLLPVGFRFRPTEEELISHYLQLKLEGMDSLDSEVIREIKICDYEPWHLPALSLVQSDDKEGYFFGIYEKNSRNQTKRATTEGFWKITGGEKPVKAPDNNAIIGKKRILTFYRGHVRSSQRTNWGMHEYYIPQTNPNANQMKSGENVDAANCDEGEPSTYNNASDFECQLPLAHDMDIEEERTQLQESLDYFEREESRMLASAHGNNDYHGLQSAFETNGPDENFAEFLDSVIVDWDQDSSGEITHANIFNDSTLPESISGVYFEDGALSSDTDTEVLLAQDMSLQMLSEPPIDSSHSRRENDVMLRNQISRQAASSVNVVHKPPQTNRLQLVTDEHSGTQELKQQQSKAKEAAERRASVDFHLKKTSITESNKEAEVAQGKNAEKGMKLMQNATAITNWKGFSFISWETSPPLSSSPSVYLSKMVLGAIMFYFFAREVVLCGQWC